MKRATENPSERARALKLAHPELSYAQIAERVGMSKQGAARACQRRGGKRGRPPTTHAERVAKLESQLAELEPDSQCPEHGCSRWRCTEAH